MNQLVAFDAPCCTGKAGKLRPTGTFPIKEKIKDKRSNIFGSLYRGGRKVFGVIGESTVVPTTVMWGRLCRAGCG
ncbi:hypothetical protein OAN94_01570 [Verrucomicrobiales bacterium]|nr:hypothetical protein [Verrucomicrobiales bacterium]MDC0502937.1 hypothetical protein [Verrucomicrobiales bacterium]